MIGIQELFQHSRFTNCRLATHNDFTAFAHDSLSAQKICFNDKLHIWKAAESNTISVS